MGKIKNSGFQHIFGLGSMDNETEIIPIIADGDDRDAPGDPRHHDRDEARRRPRLVQLPPIEVTGRMP